MISIIYIIINIFLNLFLSYFFYSLLQKSYYSLKRVCFRLSDQIQYYFPLFLISILSLFTFILRLMRLKSGVMTEWSLPEHRLIILSLKMWRIGMKYVGSWTGVSHMYIVRFIFVGRHLRGSIIIMVSRKWTMRRSCPVYMNTL